MRQNFCCIFYIKIPRAFPWRIVSNPAACKKNHASFQKDDHTNNFRDDWSQIYAVQRYLEKEEKHEFSPCSATRPAGMKEKESVNGKRYASKGRTMERRHMLAE